MVHVEVIDGCSISFEDVTHETILVEVAISGYNSLIIFNVIKSPSNPIILGLSW